MQQLTIVGGGLSGSEAAWQAAQRGIEVVLLEMRPKVQTGAHSGPNLAELVCSNSLGSDLPDRASGLLKSELRLLNSLLLECADKTSVPAGGALAVGRDEFAALVTERLGSHPKIRIEREEALEIPDGPVIIASGPLTSESLSKAISEISGQEHLFFYDALSPIVTFESINFDKAFRASRYERGEQEEGDYINCPLNKEEYESFVRNLVEAERIELKSFELDLEKGVKAGADKYFEGCLPIEIIAGRGRDSLAYGPMRPVGITDPKTGRWPHAVLQLRQDNLAGDLYNLVGFQTNLKFPEQKRVFRMIPGLENAEFVRYGQMHRNTFISSPNLLRPTLQFHNRDDLLFAGQITGVEGYCGNIATGLLAGINAARLLTGAEPVTPPETTMLGALCRYVTQADPDEFQPMKANMGILPALDSPNRLGKRQRAAMRAERAVADMKAFIADTGI